MFVFQSSQLYAESPHFLTFMVFGSLSILASFVALFLPGSQPLDLLRLPAQPRDDQELNGHHALTL